MAAGMSAGTFSPVSFLWMKHGAAWMAGQKTQPMLVLSWKPKAAAGGAVGYAFGDFQGDVVEQVNVFCVVDYEGVFRFES